jgi:hypothetical protein
MRKRPEVLQAPGRSWWGIICGLPQSRYKSSNSGTPAAHAQSIPVE